MYHGDWADLGPDMSALCRDIEDPRASNKWLQILRVTVYLTVLFGAVLWSVSGTPSPAPEAEAHEGRAHEGRAQV